MKTFFPTSILAAIILCAVPLASFAQNPFSQDQTSAADPAGPPNTRAGYYIEDGETHHAWIMLRKATENAVSLVIPPQEGYPEAVVFMPDQVSEWGFDNGKSSYVGARVETAAGPELYFMELLSVKPGDGSRIAYLSDKVLPVATYFRVVDGEATEVGTEKNAAPLMEYFASETGYRTPDPGFKYPGRIRNSAMERYYAAFTDRNDKLISQNRFGVMVSGGVALPYLPYVQTVAGRILPQSKPGVTFSAGALLRFPMESGAVSFQPEILFSHTSSSPGMDNPWVDFDEKAKFSMSSIRASLLFRYNHIRSRSKWMPYIEAGPESDYGFGHLRHTALEYAPSGFFAGGREDLKLSSSPYLGFAIGAGAEYYIDARQAVWFGVRYSRMSNLLFGRPPHTYIHRFEIVAAFSLFNF